MSAGHAVASRDAPGPSAPSPPDTTLKLASLLLQYPSASLFSGLDVLAAAAADASPRKVREHLLSFVGWLRRTSPADVARHYVQIFDLRRRCALYLTYYRYGDTRNRGMALVEFKSAYRSAGFTPTDDELPDYLPMVLEFAALCDRGRRLLHGHRTDLELLHRALVAAESPYAEVVAAVAASLPALGRRELRQVLTAWQSGPPTEEVGLEPFAPPDYLTGYGNHAPGEPKEQLR